MASTVKVKGLLKGLRYISQIFESEKEPEMQIGFPTDVKHVAHIGLDGPSAANSPSWMNEYKSTPEASAPSARSGLGKELPPCPDKSRTEEAKAPGSKDKQKRRNSSTSSSAGNLSLGTANPSDAPKNIRQHRSSGGSFISDNQELTASEKSSKDGPPTAKHPRKKKTKGTSKSKGQSSITDVDPLSESGPKHAKKNSTESCASSVLESLEEENNYDEISKEFRDL